PTLRQHRCREQVAPPAAARAAPTPQRYCYASHRRNQARPVRGRIPKEPLARQAIQVSFSWQNISVRKSARGLGRNRLRLSFTHAEQTKRARRQRGVSWCGEILLQAWLDQMHRYEDSELRLIVLKVRRAKQRADNRQAAQSG